MPQVEAEADIGDDHIVFDIGHQAVDKPDMLNVLPGDDFDVEVVSQAVGELFQEKPVGLEILFSGYNSSIPMIWSLA